MKTFTLTLYLMLAMQVAGFSQILPDSAYWKVQHGQVNCVDPNGVSDICWEKQYQLFGDTLINDQTYSKVYSSGRNRDPETNTWTYFNDGYIGAIRGEEDSERFYFLEKNASSDTLLYDFDLVIGDTLPESYTYSSGIMGYYIYVDAIDTVYWEEESIVRFHLNGAGTGQEYLLKGIGSTLGLLEQITHFFEHHYDLLCFKNYDSGLTYPEDGNCELITGLSEHPVAKDFEISITPNPVTFNTILEIEGYAAHNMKVEIYTAIGQKVKEFHMPYSVVELKSDSYKPGVYFIRILANNQLLGTEKFMKR